MVNHVPLYVIANFRPFHVHPLARSVTRKNHVWNPHFSGSGKNVIFSGKCWYYKMFLIQILGSSKWQYLKIIISKYLKTTFCSVNKRIHRWNTLKNTLLPHPRVLLDPVTTPGRPVTWGKIHYLRKKTFILTLNFPEFSGSRDPPKTPKIKNLRKKHWILPLFWGVQKSWIFHH